MGSKARPGNFIQSSTPRRLFTDLVLTAKRLVNAFGALIERGRDGGKGIVHVNIAAKYACFLFVVEITLSNIC